MQPAINLAHVYLEQENATAARQGLTGVETPELEKDRETLWYVHNLYGRLLELEGELESAAQRFRQAIAVIEDLRASVLTPELKQTFFRKHRAPYENLVQVLWKLAQPNEALYIMEKMRARSLADQLHNVLITRGVTPSLRQQEEDFRSGGNALAAPPPEKAGLEEISYQKKIEKLKRPKGPRIRPDHVIAGPNQYRRSYRQLDTFAKLQISNPPLQNG